jgi:hypothetical protein
MHRCGTSLTARVLNLLGYSLGPEEDLLEHKFDNPAGFWEQRPIVEINDPISKRSSPTPAPCSRRSSEGLGAGLGRTRARA